MSNVEKAAQVIDQWAQTNSINSHSGDPHALAHALADAGLLMPELPKPDKEGLWGPAWEAGVEAEIRHHASRIYMKVEECRLSAVNARELALALLAAANHAKGKA